MTKNFKWWVAHFEESLCAALFSVMAIITFGNVITRYFLKYSFAFTEEIVVSFFVWLTLLGTAIAFREQSHLGFTFLVERLPRKFQRGLLWLSAGLGAVLFLFLIYFSILQLGDEIALEITSSGIGVPQWWYTIGMPVFSILVILRIFQGAGRVSKRMGKG
jgi:TRAP-type C4-dicarboxylate transport system permease small subunit